MIQRSPRETWEFDTAHLGRRVLVFDHLDSTNTYAAQLATEEGNTPAVVADFQTAGRGQYGRVWQSRPSTSLLMSVVLYPPPELRRPVILTAFAAVAVAEAVFELTGVQARLKWPNDLLIRGKKVCGLLIEQHASTVIIGIGLNLSQTEEEFLGEGLPDATSLELVSTKEVAPRKAAELVISHLDQEYDRLVRGERVAVEADWKWRVGLLGRHVAIELTDGSNVSGRLHDMGFDGLELDIADGFFRVILPESVAHIRAV